MILAELPLSFTRLKLFESRLLAFLDRPLLPRPQLGAFFFFILNFMLLFYVDFFDCLSAAVLTERKSPTFNLIQVLEGSRSFPLLGGKVVVFSAEAL
jgi:hypothetical protein